MSQRVIVLTQYFTQSGEKRRYYDSFRPFGSRNMTVIFTTSVGDKRAYLSGLVISKIVTNVRLSVFLKTLEVVCLFYVPRRTLSKQIKLAFKHPHVSERLRRPFRHPHTHL